MTRVFASLIVANLILFFITTGLGVFSFLNRSNPPDRHVLLAVLTLLLSCLIQVVTFTYLTITGKVIVQAVHVGKLEDSPIHAAKSLKRNFTHQLAIAFVAILVVTASGASAWRTQAPSALHFSAAVLAILAHGFAWRNEFRILRINEALLQQILSAYSPPEVDHKRSVEA